FGRGQSLSTGASAPPDTRHLGRAAPLDNTRPRALYRTGAGGAEKAGRPQPLRARRARGSAERFEVDVLAKSGLWSVGHRSARRQPWQWQRAEPARARAAAAGFRRAAA